MKNLLIPSMDVSDETALRYGIDAVSGFTGNPHFTDITPTPAQLKALVDDYTLSLGKAANRGMEEVALKNSSKAAMLQLLRDMLRMANAIAKGDVVALASVGLPMSKDRSRNVLGVAAPKVALHTNPGSIVLSTPSVPGTVSYIHQVTEDPASNKWEDKATSTARCEFSDLQPGKVYYFRIIAIGTRDQQTISPVVSRMVA